MRFLSFIINSLLIAILLCPGMAAALTLEQTVTRALNASFPLKEQDQVIRKYQFSYISTIDPYLPRFDIQTYYTRYLNNPSVISSAGTVITSRESFTFLGAISYRVFDGGERYAKRKGAFSGVEREKERLKSTRTDVVYGAKTAFFTALGRKAVVDRRAEAYEITKRIYDLTKARYQEGITKKSDLLQAEVRLSTVKIELFTAEKEYEKALDDLRSIVGAPFQEPLEPEGLLVEPERSFRDRELIERALAARPDVLTQAREIDRLNMVYKEKKAAWFPKIDAELSQSRRDKTFFPENRDDLLVLSFTFPLFDGVGRYYNMEAAQSDVQAGRYRLDEIRRNVELDIVKALADYDLSRKNVVSFRELLREATSNFEQAYGEYKMGKGDILTLIQAEKDLARAKEYLVVALYQANNSLANVEKVAYLTER
jgi:outer membrane protein